MPKKRAMTSDKASRVKRQGHLDAIQFAEVLGVGKEFKSEPQAKRDVIDSYGYAYSVKSGEKKWQIFLYAKKRFEEDFEFKAINKLGDLFLECINCFPEDRKDYIKNKIYYKNCLKNPMEKLCNELQNKDILSAFLNKSIFNSGEVHFLVVKDGKLFHVFWQKDVIDILKTNYTVENSKARNKNQIDKQKVVFKVNGKTHGEIEIRNDSNIHYREVKFWLDKVKTLNLLQNSIQPKEIINKNIILYGTAIRKLKKHYKKEEM